MHRLAIVISSVMVAASAAAAPATPPNSTAPAGTAATPVSSTTATSAATTHAPATTAARARTRRGTAHASSTTAPLTAPSATTSGAATSADDSTMRIRAGQDGTVFRSLTVEGEDRIHFEFERPPLALQLDPSNAPGLDWGSARDVLDRTVPDLAAPLVAGSKDEPSPFVAHPWLGHFAAGAVATFRPDVKGVERWTLTVVNARGETVAGFQGNGEPPREIVWDGRMKDGTPVVPGLTYSYVFQAHDRAGNKRNFIGEGFRVSAYRLEVAGDPVLVFSGRELPGSDAGRSSLAAREAAAPIVIEAATWLNQSPRTATPVRVSVAARSMDEAQALASRVARQLMPYLLGDPARVQTMPQVQPDAPEGGAVSIVIAR
ncbi:MAG: hypothetical protein HY076_09280 [Candidatus Eisenbacteria bacterium]|uniref:FlgD Ig-like domain-containing protein n=1 Tax=Eiseniibacteriota bacterium TaxID=2212470 RepID=A0A9D6LA94_UNCEI|nr:hypothetical protein [Candidatus Eisenbacteria bacterium]